MSNQNLRRTFEDEYTSFRARTTGIQTDEMKRVHLLALAQEFGSPELKAKINQEALDRHRAQKAKADAAAKRARRERRQVAFVSWSLGIIGTAAYLLAISAVFYGAVKFVKWAWVN